MRQKTRKAGKNYQYVIYSLCFVMILICLGFGSTGKSIFLAPVTTALNIPRSVFSVTDTFRFLSAALVNAFFGSLVSKFGTKRLIFAGISCLIVSMVLHAVAENFLVFYIAGVFSGIGFSFTTTTMVGSIITRWCKKGTGTVMGIILAANGIGSALLSQFITPVIYKSTFGYKNGFFIIAACIVAVLLLFILFYREKEETAPQNKKQAKGINFEGIHIKEAIKKPYFYILAVYVFFMGVVLQGLVGTFAANLSDSSIKPGLIATVLSIYSICLSLSKILSGTMYDKLGLRFTATICNVSIIITIILMLLTGDTSVGRVLAVISAFTFALGLPLETIMLPFFAEDFFGLKSYNDILGLFCSISYVGMAAGIPLMNLFYDFLGSYDTALIISAGIMLFCCILFLIASWQSDKFKKSLRNEENL